MKIWKPWAVAAAFLLAGSGCDFGEPIKNTTGGGTGVEGILVTPEGAPVGGALVRVFSATTGSGLAKEAGTLALDSMRTNGAGAFRFPALPNGTYNLAASAHHGDTTYGLYMPGIVVVGKTNLGVDTLQIAGDLALQVRTGNTAISGASCSVAGGAWTTTSDSLGVCILTGVPPGTFQITVTHSSYEITISGDVTVIPGVLTSSGLLNLAGGGNPLPAGRHFPTLGSTVALWTFNGYTSTASFADAGPNGFTLSGTARVPLVASPDDSAAVFNGDGKFFSAANSPLLTVNGTGKITMEARVYLAAYPEGSQSYEIMGMYSGPRMLITSDGRLTVSMQRQDNTGSAYWFSPYNLPGSVPLNRWVTLAFALDSTVNPRQVYLYVDGVPKQAYAHYIGSDRFVIPGGALTVGDDAYDDLPLKGRIEEIRISNDLVLGAGPALLHESVLTPTPMPRIAVVSNADVTISSAVPGQPDVNQYGNKNRGKENGTGPGTFNMTSTSRGLIRFPIPQGYTATNITSAVIRLTNPQWYASNVSGPFRVDMHRMLKSWKEGNGSMTANSATIDGATALERFWGSQDGSEDWTERFAGLNNIDAAAIPAASVTKSPGDMSSWDFYVTALVKAWAADSTTNFGIILASDFPASDALVRAYPVFNTREAAVADSLKPLLIINGGP